MSAATTLTLDAPLSSADRRAWLTRNEESLKALLNGDENAFELLSLLMCSRRVEDEFTSRIDFSASEPSAAGLARSLDLNEDLNRSMPLSFLLTCIPPAFNAPSINMGSLEGRFALYEMCWNALNAAILSLFNLVCVTSAEAVTLKPSFVMAIDLYLHYGVGEKGEAYQVAKDPAWRAQLWEKDFHVSMFETFYFALGSAWQAGNVFAKDTLLFVRSVLFRLQVRHTELARTWAEQFAKHKTLFTLESAFEAKARDFLDLHSDLSGEAQLKAAIDDLMALLVYEGQELPREWSALFEIGNRAFTSPLAAEESSNHFVRNLAEAAKNYSPNDFKLRVKVGELIGLYERLNKVMAVEFLKPYAEELKIALERYVLNLRARPELMKDFDTSVFPDDSSSTIQVMFAILSKDAMLDPLSDLESLMKRFLSIIPVLMLPQGKFQTEHVLALECMALHLRAYALSQKPIDTAEIQRIHDELLLASNCSEIRQKLIEEVELAKGVLRAAGGLLQGDAPRPWSVLGIKECIEADLLILTETQLAPSFQLVWADELFARQETLKPDQIKAVKDKVKETYFGRLTALADQYEQAIKAEASAQELTAIQSKISHVMQHYDNVISSSEAFGWLMIDVRRTSFKSRYVGPLHFQSQRDGLVAAESVSISATHAEIQREFDRIKKKYLAPRESISASPHDNTP